MKEIVTKSMFLPSDIHQSPTCSGEEKDPRVKQFRIRAGMCLSKSLLIFTSVSILLSCATTQRGPGGRAMEQERKCWPKSELQFKGTAPPSHVHTGFGSITCRQIFKVLTLRHKKPLKKAALSLLCWAFLKSYNVSWWIRWRLSCAALCNLSWLMEIFPSVACSQF